MDHASGIPVLSGFGATRFRSRLLAARALAAAAVLATAAAGGAATAEPADEECLACHDGLTGDDGSPVAADLGSLPDSIHGMLGLSCVDCHADLAGAELPHDDALPPADCSTCHDDAVSAWRSSIHADLASCADCHGAHDILPADDSTSPTNHFRIAATCGSCHGTEVGTGLADRIHGEALTGKGLNVAPSCATCHGFHDIRAVDDPESRVAHAAIPDACGSCHEAVEATWTGSVHGMRLAEGDETAAVCSSCHLVHGAPGEGHPPWRVAVIEECGTCHEQSFETFADTFHGKVTALGFERVAGCADCHGSHDILPAEHPESRVGEARLLETCRSCHPRARPKFADYQPHPDKHDPETPVLFWSAKLMHLLLLGVFGFFFLHTALWVPRSFLERRRQRREAQARGPRR